jgi:uncharacterized protein (TIGR02271 family)
MKAQSRETSGTTQGRSTAVGVFEDRTHADRAVAELRQAGFREDQIGVAMRHNAGDFELNMDTDEGNSEVGAGAATGALTGLGLGALAGLGVLAGVIPVIGPAIAGGTLGVILSNAAAGAGIAGLVGALIGLGIPEEEASYYQGEFEAGKVVVTVQAADRVREAEEILSRNYAYNIHTQGNAGGMGMKMQAPARGSGMVADTAKSGRSAQGETIQVKEEELRATKHPVETGDVRVRKEVRSETKTLEVPVEREEIVVERRPVRKDATGADFREGQEIRIPVHEEEVEVIKTPVVTEEVKVGKRTVRDTEQVTGQVRKERVQIDREGDVEIRSTNAESGKKTT